MESGDTPARSMRCAMRYVMTRVLPLPAPASIRTGPLAVSTASRCCGFNCERYDKSRFLNCSAGLLRRHSGQTNRRGSHAAPRNNARLAPSVGLSARLHHAHQAAGLAVLAGTVLAKKFPRVDAVLVPVIPGKPYAVFPHRLDLGGTRQRLAYGSVPATGLSGSPGWRPSFSRSSWHNAHG